MSLWLGNNNSNNNNNYDFLIILIKGIYLNMLLLINYKTIKEYNNERISSEGSISNNSGIGYGNNGNINNNPHESVSELSINHY